VDIAIPNTGSIRTGLAVALLRLSRDPRYDLQFHFRIAKPTANNRNQIVKRFLSFGEGHGWLLMIDDDVVPLPDCNPLDLVERDLDVVGVLCPIWKWREGDAMNPVVWNFMPLEGAETDAVQGCVPVRFIGSGCMLIARRVLEHPAMRAPFMDTWDEFGEKVGGEDRNFCLRAREAGFGVFAAMDYRAEHENMVGLLSVGNMQQLI
jgi:hypothetical protein